MIIIKNIIFDLGGVILKNKPISILKKFQFDNKTCNELKRFFENWNDLDLGNELLEDKYNKCCFPKEYEILYKDILLNYYKYRDINMEIINCINKLKQENYNIYILSDNNIESTKYYKNNIKNIDGWIVSCDYNTVKKDGNIFEILINKYNLNVNECYFIDDNLNNIEEAKKYGIKGFVFNENDNINILYQDMKDKKIII